MSLSAGESRKSQKLKYFAPPVIGQEVGGCGKQNLIHKTRTFRNVSSSKIKFKVICHTMILRSQDPCFSCCLFLSFLFFFIVVVAIFCCFYGVFLFAWLSFCILNRRLDLAHHTTWGALGEVFNISILGRLVGC